ncbi:hypothetical protein JMJ55_01680 [Belnapia sp. T6]|uniref:Uncharacterized protein n=1 Tax=Belnapia mucosa TaxID=2804532 RepID=A0ABS1UYE4_9PROT|nr:hypothetical protein [Belnapia mucosa]MBL6454012.1 hypothetical protein [Belnapia mucosa]
MIPSDAIPPIATRTHAPGPGPVAVAAPAAMPAAPAPAATPSPSLRIDPALGIVVMEFRDDTGQVAASLPTERELAAYRNAARSGQAPGPSADPEPTPAPTRG